MAPERRAPANKWAIALAVGLAIGFLYIVRLAVLPFVLAAAIAFAADPAVKWLASRVRLRRSTAAIIVYLVLIAAIAAGSYVALSRLSSEVLQVARHLPALLERFLHELFGGDAIDLFGRRVQASDIAAQATNQLVGTLGQADQWIIGALYAFGALTGAILVVVLIFYFLCNGPGLAAGALWVVPPEYREEVQEVAAKIAPMLRRYLIGLCIIFVFASVATWLVIQFILHLPFPFLLGLVTGALELIPVLGPAISATLIGLLSLEQHGIWALAAFAAYVTAFRLAIDRLLSPIILGSAARIHPVVVMFALLAGGLLLGVIGVILAVPIAASVKIVLGHYYSQPTRRRSG